MAPQRSSLVHNSLSVFVRPLTPRDAEKCHQLTKASRAPAMAVEQLTHLLRTCSATTLGVFTTTVQHDDFEGHPPGLALAPRNEIYLGFMIGETDYGNGQGATLKIHGVWVLPEYEHLGVGNALVKGYTDRVRPAKVAKRIVKKIDDEEKARAMKWYTDAGFAVDPWETNRIMLDCF
ncbi:hypothetical protein BZA77DRAFT_301451 [Pyronema omphalodes]|nr:hypothetical protein BZA77DRAFT_301451 [Pyronema omphalodes]